MMPSTDDQPTAYLLPAESIALTSEQVAWALTLSQAAPELQEQWQCYLSGLALLGFQTWLQARSPELSLRSPWLLPRSTQPQRLRPEPEPASGLVEDSNRSKMARPTSARLPLSQQVSQLMIGDTKLYLIPIGYVDDPLVSLPSTVPTTWSPDLYVLVEVLEEISEVRIISYLPQSEVDWDHADLQRLEPVLDQPMLNQPALDQPSQQERLTDSPDESLLSHFDRSQPNSSPSHPSQPDELLIPTYQFVEHPDRLLFQLRYAQTFGLTSQSTEAGAATTTEPMPVHADADADAHLATMPAPLPLVNPATSATKPIVVNVARWFEHQVDRITEELAWMLLPPLDLSGSLLSSQTDGLSEDLEDVLQTLRYEQQIAVPPEARSAYRDLTLEAAELRLYVVTWRLPATSEWSLLVVLGAQPGRLLSPGIKLLIADQHEPLIELVLNQEPYLYAQVIGQLNEQFQLSIALPNGACLTLPPLVLDAELS